MYVFVWEPLCKNVSMSHAVFLNGNETCHPHHVLRKNVMPLFFLKIPCLFLLFCGSDEMFNKCKSIIQNVMQ